MGGAGAPDRATSIELAVMSINDEGETILAVSTGLMPCRKRHVC